MISDMFSIPDDVWENCGEKLRVGFGDMKNKKKESLRKADDEIWMT